MNNTNKNPPSCESGFCLAPPVGLEHNDDARKLACKVAMRPAHILVTLGMWLWWQTSSKGKTETESVWTPFLFWARRIKLQLLILTCYYRQVETTTYRTNAVFALFLFG